MNSEAEKIIQESIDQGVYDFLTLKIDLTKSDSERAIYVENYKMTMKPILKDSIPNDNVIEYICAFIIEISYQQFMINRIREASNKDIRDYNETYEILDACNIADQKLSQISTLSITTTMLDDINSAITDINMKLKNIADLIIKYKRYDYLF